MQNWYNYLSNFAQIELLRITAALIDGTADTIFGRRLQQADGEVLTEGEAQLKQGVQELSTATKNLGERIKERFGINPMADTKSFLQRLLNRNKKGSRGRTAAAIGKDAQRAAAKSDPFIALKEAGVPLDGQGTQRFVEALGSDVRTEGNPYLLQTVYSKSGTVRGMPQQQPSAGAAAAVPETKKAAAGDQGIITPAFAKSPEQVVAGDAKAVLGSATDAAPVEDMLKKQNGVEIKTTVVEEGNKNLLGAAQAGK